MKPMARDDYHHGDLREALLRATLKVVRRSGPSSVSLRAVAREAGVSEAAPYHHFSDKNELLAVAAAASFDAMGAHLKPSLEGKRDARAALVALCVAWVDFALTQPGSFRLLFGAHVEDLVRFDGTRQAGQT